MVGTNYKEVIEDNSRQIMEKLSDIPYDDDHNIYFMSLALCGEAGELANKLKKHWRGDGPHDIRSEDIKEELVDVFNYVIILASLLGVENIEEEALKKSQKVFERYHGVSVRIS